MQIIKKELEIIKFEAENTTNKYAIDISSLGIDTTINENNKITNYYIRFLDEKNDNDFEYISEQTYKELIEYLGW